nr:hypothetical protein [bacterium]
MSATICMMLGLALAVCSGCGQAMPQATATPPLGTPLPAATPSPTPAPQGIDLEGQVLSWAREGTIGWGLLHRMRQAAGQPDTLFPIYVTRIADGDGALSDGVENQTRLDDGIPPGNGQEEMAQAMELCYGVEGSPDWPQVAQLLQTASEKFEPAFLQYAPDAQDPLQAAHSLGLRIYPACPDGLDLTLPIRPSYALGEATAAQIIGLRQAGLVCRLVGRHEMTRQAGYPPQIQEGNRLYWSDTLVYYLEHSEGAGKPVPVKISWPLGIQDEARARAEEGRLQAWLQQHAGVTSDRLDMRLIQDGQGQYEISVYPELVRLSCVKETSWGLFKKDALQLVQDFPGARLSYTPLWVYDAQLAKQWNSDYLGDGLMEMYPGAVVEGRAWETGIYPYEENGDAVGFTVPQGRTY